MADGMEEIIDEFVAEAEESLDKIDPLFIELETKGNSDKELLNDIFRSMHTIKGAAGFLGFQTVVDVAHHAESIMKRLREDEMAISSSVISAILRSVDMLKAILYHIKSKDGVEEDVGPLIAELEAVLGGTKGKPALAEAAGKAGAAKKPRAAAKADKKPAAPEASEPKASSGKALSGEALSGEAPSSETPATALVRDVFSDLERQLAGVSPQKAVPPEGGAGRSLPPKAERPPAGPEHPPQQQDKSKAAQAAEGIQTLRVDVSRIDSVMNLTGEIVLVRNRLLNISNALDAKYSGDEHVEGLGEAVAFLDLVTADIQLAVMKMRMQPIKKVFSKFPRLVRDLSQSLGKDVELNIEGENTEVDRSVIEKISDPLVHIIRNALDHGIEHRAERLAKGKPERGTVDIAAFQRGNQIVIEVSDDGKGIDIERIKRLAAERGLATEAEAWQMDDKEAMNLVFLPGFSTMEVASEISGRGVGMDVVKTNISKLNGYIEIDSTRDVGTTFRISIPLTLAIIQALMVRTGGVQYAIPLAPIEETIKVSREEIEHVTGRKVLAIRGKVFPLAELEAILGYAPSGRLDYRYVLVIAIGNKRFCVGVDELLGQEEVVIKIIEGIDTEATGTLGATITGDGNVVLILDPSSMARNISRLAAV